MKLTFCCGETNDLYRLLSRLGKDVQRFPTPTEAVENAERSAGVLLLAEEYPAATTELPPGLLERAAEKDLRLYLEYPAALDGIPLGPPKTTQWERQVVSTDRFGPDLPRLTLLQLHGCHYVPVKADDPWAVIARVAGYDRAVYGISEGSAPLLFPHSERLLIATSKLSGFITGRYGPEETWRKLWEAILHWLSDETIPLDWTPEVRPSYGAGEAFPPDGESVALRRAAEWYGRSRLLVTEGEEAALIRAIKKGEEIRPVPSADVPSGDGSRGILEGYASAILHDGNQDQRIPLRADCQAESSMPLALHGMLSGDKTSLDTAAHLQDYLYFRSGMHGGVRGDANHPAYGLIGWGAHAPAWEVANYGDDNARTILGTLLTRACLAESRWDGPMIKAILANFRTTGRQGFRGDRIDNPELERNGWRHYYDREIVNLSPHFESWMWACYLWLYRRMEFAPLYERTLTALRHTMEGFPDGWRWGSNTESARMLLPLSWLLRVEDNAEHRGWLVRILDDLLETQEPSGALRERIRASATTGHYTVPESNEAYGTKETPLFQRDGDPVSDQLYTTGFALIGLREANAVLDVPRYREAEDRLAEFLCRVQTRSESFPYLDGTWFRAFDFRRWEYWASSADAGWGAWCVEAGWGPAWTAAALGLRQKRTTFWDMTEGTVDIRQAWELMPQLFGEAGFERDGVASNSPQKRD